MRTSFASATLGCGLVAVVLMASLASAADPIVGSSGDDHLRGGNGPDVVLGMAGDDVVAGNNGPDIVKGGPGDDIVWTGRSGPGDKGYGGRGDDVVNNFGSGAAGGLLDGGPGTDKCRGNKHDTYVGCEIVVIME